MNFHMTPKGVILKFYRDHVSNTLSLDLQPSFRALADPTRRAILKQLCRKELTISEVVDKFDLTRTAVRKHLTILEEGNLITLTPRGKERITELNPAGVQTVADWFDFFDQFWDSRLDLLKNAIESDRKTHSTRKKKR